MMKTKPETTPPHRKKVTVSAMSARHRWLVMSSLFRTLVNPTQKCTYEYLCKRVKLDLNAGDDIDRRDFSRCIKALKKEKVKIKFFRSEGIYKIENVGDLPPSLGMYLDYVRSGMKPTHKEIKLAIKWLNKQPPTANQQHTQQGQVCGLVTTSTFGLWSKELQQTREAPPAFIEYYRKVSGDSDEKMLHELNTLVMFWGEAEK